MSSLARFVAAFIFFAILAAFIAQPIANLANGNDDNGGRATPAPTVTPTPKPSPSPSETDAPIVLPRGQDQFLGDPRTAYPDACLSPGSTVADAGLVAGYRGGAVRIVSPTGSRVAAIDARPPVQWSPSGRRLLTGGGRVWTSEGRRAGRLKDPPGGVSSFAWSPRSDCVVFVAGDTLYVRRLDAGGSKPRELFHADVADFVFSPNGRKLALVMQSGASRTLRVADLDSGRIETLRASTPQTVAVDVVGWTSNLDLLYGVASGESIATDGVRLRSFSVIDDERGARRNLDASVLNHSDFYDQCGGRRLVVASESRDTTAGSRLAYALPGPPPPTFLTPEEFAFVSPACSPGGQFIAAVRAPEGATVDDRRLVLLEPDGSFVEPLTTDKGFADENPRWAQAGLVFVRRPLADGAPQVWFIPPGEKARSARLTIDEPDAVYGYFDWMRVVDWSADQPNGRPAP